MLQWTEVTEGMTVEIAGGPKAGEVGKVIKMQGDPSCRRYRIETERGESTWATQLKRPGAADGGAKNADPNWTPPKVGAIVSPAMAAMSGQTVKRGSMASMGTKNTNSASQQARDEFPKGTIVEILDDNKWKGKCGTVRAIQGEGADKKYKVEIEAALGSSWAVKLKLATRELEQEEVRVKLTDLYEVKKKLGAGAFGSVHKVQVKATGQIRAMKNCNKQLVKNVDQIWKEVKIMQRLDHPNICKLYDTFEDHKCVYLVLELCTGGELFDRILDSVFFSESDAAVVMQQVLRGMCYMHAKRIIHRDLKPENFLLVSNTDLNKAMIKVIDFGLARDFPEDGKELTTRVGSPYYVAPQILTGGYNEAIDVWSLGVILFILLSGVPPFEGETDPEIFEKIKKGTYQYKDAVWNDVSQDAKDLIDTMLVFKPADRCTCDGAMAHKWVQQKAPAAAPGRRGSVVDNLRNFQKQNRFKRAALQVIATHLDEEQIKGLRETFIALDTNGDGFLSSEELKDGMAKLAGGEVADLQTLLDTVDANGSGKIDYTEFLSATLDKKMYEAENVCWAAFRIFDKDGNGKISRDELTMVLASAQVQAVSEVDVKDILDAVDKNGDGELDFQEFMQMMRGAV